jgi:hypothetical protein
MHNKIFNQFKKLKDGKKSEKLLTNAINFGTLINTRALQEIGKHLTEMKQSEIRSLVR